MVQLSLTPPMRRLLEARLERRTGDGGPERQPDDRLGACLAAGAMPHTLLAALLREQSPSASGGIGDATAAAAAAFLAHTRGARLLPPAPAPAPPMVADAAERARVQARLRAIERAHEDAAYARGAAGAVTAQGPLDDAAAWREDARQLRSLLGAFANVALTMAAVGLAVWCVVPHSLTTDPGMVGGLCSLLLPCCLRCAHEPDMRRTHPCTRA
jgi:hypothetical protein